MSKRSISLVLACGLLLPSCALFQREVVPKPTVGKAPFGELPDGGSADLYTLTNSNGLRVKLTNYGAITVAVEVPDRRGKLADVTLGYDTLDGWLKDSSHFGSTIGRYANRIANAAFTLDGQTFKLAANCGPHHIHGGLKPFDKVLWHAQTLQTPTSVGVKFTYLSKDGEEGYPGDLQVAAFYSLNNNDEFRAEFTATTDKPTIVNLTNHTYWNLAGPAADNILGHILMISAERYTPTDKSRIPTGEIAPVLGTPLDFTAPTAIGRRIADLEGGGYDHNFVLRSQSGRVVLAARAYEPRTGRVMEVLTNQPGMQLYTGNHLGPSIKGKRGAPYAKHAGFCLETQHYPDSPNKPAFPPVVLRPGETYKHITVYRFSTKPK